jgi:hypothetical protein
MATPQPYEPTEFDLAMLEILTAEVEERVTELVIANEFPQQLKQAS